MPLHAIRDRRDRHNRLLPLTRKDSVDAFQFKEPDA